jgi:hypothetical protein
MELLKRLLVENFLSFATLVVRHRNRLMIAERFNFLLSKIERTLAFFTASIASQRDRPLKRQHVLTLKKCPKCAEQLPISALVCDSCDYNFLSRTVGHRHKLLPSPSDPLAHEVSAANPRLINSPRQAKFSSRNSAAHQARNL